MKVKKVMLNAAIGGYQSGTMLRLEFDGDTPTDPYWRRRFNDMKIEKAQAENLKQSYTPTIEFIKTVSTAKRVTNNAS